MSTGFFCIEHESTFQGLLLSLFILGLAIWASTEMGLRRWRRAHRKTQDRFTNANTFLQVFRLVGILISVGTVVYALFYYGNANEPANDEGAPQGAPQGAAQGRTPRRSGRSEIQVVLNGALSFFIFYLLSFPVQIKVLCI